MSTITSRCGNVTLMGLGIMVIGLWSGLLVYLLGQLWWQHQVLENALVNATTVLAAEGSPTISTLTSLLDADLHTPNVVVDSLTVSNNHVSSAVVSMPAALTPWPQWLGPPPVAIVARL
ncbi:MAG: hypothetical protein OWU84_02835 [Firmicutes bacterium]|nr:hypothetical protein [Bacillota bacterium]